MTNTPALGRRHRLPERERQRIGRELRSRYEGGKSIRDLCADTGYSIGRVRRLLLDAGVDFRGRGGSRKRPAG